jgi:hypothetical protein
MSVRRRLSPSGPARRFAGTIPPGTRLSTYSREGEGLWTTREQIVSSSQLTTTSVPQSARRNVAQFRGVSSWCSAPNIDEW